ncbi:MAG: hypothetical protein ACI4K6_07455, partial [Candidatus Fimenecus sp.]
MLKSKTGNLFRQLFAGANPFIRIHSTLKMERIEKLWFVGTIYTVGRGDSPVRGKVCEADKRVPEFGEFCPRR